MAAVPVNPGIIDTEMLRSCFGGSASELPEPRANGPSAAVPFFLGLGPADNGKPSDGAGALTARRGVPPANGAPGQSAWVSRRPPVLYDAFTARCVRTEVN